MAVCPGEVPELVVVTGMLLGSLYMHMSGMLACIVYYTTHCSDVAPAQVLRTEGLWVPLVNLHTVFILPGIPKLFQRMVTAHKGRFMGGPAYQTKTLYSSLGEGDLAKFFSEVADKHPQVRMGSYPNTDGQDKRFKVKLQLESRDAEELQKATEAVKERIPTHALTDPDSA